MDSIENMFSYMSPARLMIKILEYSHDILHSAPDQTFECQCQDYLNMCIDAARDETLKIIFSLIVHCIGFNFTGKITLV